MNRFNLLRAQQPAASLVTVLRLLSLLLAFAAAAGEALAGPPYVSDDPQPTDYKHYEIYLFTAGTHTRQGITGVGGIDFNYGAAPDLQLTAMVPIAYTSPAGGTSGAGLGNIEAAAKFRVLHQANVGWDIAVFPRLFLPAGSSTFGERHVSLLLPVWLQKDWGSWSTFGGGGCVLNRGGDSKNYCLSSWALVRQVLPRLQLGAELVHQTPAAEGGRAMTGVGTGMRYDFDANYHLLTYAGPGLQNAGETDRYSWYVSILFTF